MKNDVAERRLREVTAQARRHRDRRTELFAERNAQIRARKILWRALSDIVESIEANPDLISQDLAAMGRDAMRRAEVERPNP